MLVTMTLLIVKEQISCAGMEKDKEQMLNVAMLGVANHRLVPKQ